MVPYLMVSLKSRNCALAVSAVMLLSACDFVVSMVDIEAQANAAALDMEKEFGTKPHVNWNWQSGRLREVNVIFDGERIRDLRMGELELNVRRIVGARFKQHPADLLVSAR